MCPKCKATYPKASAKQLQEHHLVCQRVRSKVRGAHGQFWELEPGYVADEIQAERRGIPASRPDISSDKGKRDPSTWTAAWRETWKWAQKVNNHLRYDSRETFLADLAAHHKLLWEIGYPA